MARFKVDRRFGPFTWAGLTGLRTVSFLKIGYFGAIGIPVAAYLLRNGQLLGLDVHLPITLFWFYLSSMALALGHLLNEIACPYLIKKFPVQHEFRAHLAESFTFQATIRNALQANLKDAFAAKMRDDAKVSLADQQLLAEELAGMVLDFPHYQVDQSKPVVEINSLPKQDGFIEDPAGEWSRMNERFFPLRGAIVFFCSASALIAAWFSVRQFWIVLMATFGGLAH